MCSVIGAAVGAGVAALLLPILLMAVGFTPAGIAAGSIAAWLMSVCASLGGGGVAAGSLVAILQSWGAAGLSWIALAALAFIGGAVGWLTDLFYCIFY